MNILVLAQPIHGAAALLITLHCLQAIYKRITGWILSHLVGNIRYFFSRQNSERVRRSGYCFANGIVGRLD